MTYEVTTLDPKDHEFISRPKSIKVNLVDSPDESNLRDKIDLMFAHIKKSQEQEGRNIFDGGLVGVCEKDSGSYDSGNMSLNAFKTAYSRWAANFTGLPGCEVCSLGVGGLSSFNLDDDYLVFGERAHAKSVGGSIELLPAGTLDLEDLEAADPLLNAFSRELKEEINLPVLETKLRGLVFANHYKQFTVMYHTELEAPQVSESDYGFGAVELKQTNDTEHKKLFAVPSRNLGAFVEKYGRNIGPRSAVILLDYLEGKQ